MNRIELACERIQIVLEDNSKEHNVTEMAALTI